MKTHILLVEDDTQARNMLARALEKAGYAVTQAADGEAALDMLASSTHQGEPYDVVITDIRMSIVDGIQVLEQARNQHPPPAVILLTGFASLESALVAFRSGAYDYLLKPCDPDDLLMCVAKAVQRRQAEQQWLTGFQLMAQSMAHLRGDPHAASAINHPASPYNMPAATHGRYMSVGQLRIDRFHHTVTFEDTLLRLTPTEYALIYYLVENSGKVLGYRDIVRRTHDQDVDNTEAFLLLKQHVSNLRHKIAPDYIVNVRGTGYMVVNPEHSPEHSSPPPHIPPDNPLDDT